MSKRLLSINQRPKIEIKKYNYIINLIILNIFVINSISGNDYVSEIHLVIKGSGIQNIVSVDYGGTLPNEVIADGVNLNGCTKNCNLDKEINNVILKFYGPIDHCFYLFNHCYNIIEVDLSYFDSSGVTTMFCMFQACVNLKKVNFGNINLSSLKSFFGLFSTCTSLRTVDLSSIITSNVEDMTGMFNDCQNLISLDLSNFNVENVKEMKSMFCGCSSLIYLNINSFKLQGTVNTETIFDKIAPYTKFCIQDSTLKQILSSYGKISDCSDVCFNGNMKVDITNKICVESCQNKKYEEDNICLNECIIGNYPIFCETNDCDEYPITCYNQAPEKYYFDSNTKSYKKCYKSCKNCNGEGSETYNNCEECDNGYSFLDEPIYETNCFNKCQYYYYFDLLNKYQCTTEMSCPDNYKLLAYKKKCIDDCKKDVNYQYEYNLTCYSICPEGTIEIGNNKICNKIENKEITTIILPTTQIYEKKTRSSYIDFTTYNKMIISIITNKNKDLSTQTITEKDIEEKNDFTTYNNAVFNEITYKTKDFPTQTTTEKEKEEKNDFMTNNNAVFNEITYKNIDSASKTNVEMEIEDEPDTFEKIRKKLIKGDYTNKIDEGKDSVYIDRNFIYTVTSTKNQENNIDYNNTVIYLRQCENDLKEEYNISLNDSLYILKVDAFIDDLIIPKVEYEIFYPFNPINLTLLNLSICKDIKINIRIPLNISKDDIDEHNSSSNLYNDICYTLKNEHGIDKPIKARRIDFIKYKLSGCEEGCEFSEYDIINKIALCSCFTKIKLPILSEIKVDKKKLISNFKNIKNIGNYKILRCIHLLFDISNIFKNSSNYMCIFLLLMNTVAIFVVKLYNTIKFKNFINNLIKIYNHNKKAIKFPKKIKKLSSINLGKNTNKNSILNLFEKRITKNNNKAKPINNNKIINNKINNKGVLGRIKPKSRSFKIQNKNEYKKPIAEYIINAIFKNKSSVRTTSHLKTKTTSTINHPKRKQINYYYNDTEMNNLDYKEAIIMDNRTYCLYYISLIKSKHILISTFFYFKDYNAQIIKIYMFFFTFVSNFVFSAMFYSDSTMNKIYFEDGAFDFTYQLPKMFYSFIISISIKILLGSFGLYENSLISIKKSIKYKKGYKKVLLCLKIKLVLFFIFNYIIISCYWIYLGCFCAVYTNTQLHLVKEVTSSFCISFITPFFINLLPGIFRLYALDKKAKKVYIYKFSKILQKL